MVKTKTVKDIKNNPQETENGDVRVEPNWRQQLRFFNIGNRITWRAASLMVGAIAAYFAGYWLFFIPVATAMNLLIDAIKGQYKIADFSFAEDALKPVYLTQKEYAKLLKCSFWVRMSCFITVFPFFAYVMMSPVDTIIITSAVSGGISVIASLLFLSFVVALKKLETPYFGEPREGEFSSSFYESRPYDYGPEYSFNRNDSGIDWAATAVYNDTANAASSGGFNSTICR